NLLVGRMGVTFGVGATGLIFDGSDNSEHALPIGAAINAKAIGTIQARQRLGLGVAAITGLPLLVEDVADFRRIGGVADPSLLVKDADLDHAGLIRDGFDGVVETFSIVSQHVISCAAADDIADPLGACQGGGFQILAMQSDIQVSEESEDDEHDRKQRPDQFCANALSQALRSRIAANWISLRHGLTPA